MKNTSEVRSELQEIFKRLKTGEIEHKTANALSNVIGKALSSVALELKYHEMRSEVPDIDFLKK